VKTLQRKWFDTSAVSELTPEHVPQSAVPRVLPANGSRQATSAAEFRRDRAERLAIERAEDEGMSVPDAQPASCNTPKTGQSGGMAKR